MNRNEFIADAAYVMSLHYAIAVYHIHQEDNQ